MPDHTTPVSDDLMRLMAELVDGQRNVRIETRQRTIRLLAREVLALRAWVRKALSAERGEGCDDGEEVQVLVISEFSDLRDEAGALLPEHPRADAAGGA